MISVLDKARDFEKKYLRNRDEENCPRFHVTGGVGWINDPNGFSLYKDEYHLFFQYHPYDTKWGPMHWGHVKTNDFIKWERLPCALAPDQEYDKDGCFSGSAVELSDGRHLLMYTGNRNERTKNGQVQGFQTQCIAIGDGINYTKLDINPVIDGTSLPIGNSTHDFRDPKCWYEDGRYYCVIANRSADHSGTVLLYESEDGVHWSFSSILSSCHNQFGKMWECPDFFHLDGKDVLLTSTQEMLSIGLEFHPGNTTLCIIGNYDKAAKHLVRENVHAVDYGTDFYAMQTLEAKDGRRIMIAWMQSWESSGCKYPNLPFFGQMTLPRELSIKNGRLIQNPVRELENYRTNKISYRNVIVNDEMNLQGISGRYVDMTVKVRPVNKNNVYRYFRINVAKSGECVTTIRHKTENSTIRVDRTHSGFPFDIVNMRDFPIPLNGELKIRVILDRFSLEIFVNDGEQAASFVLYTPLEADSISFSSEGGAIIDVEKWDLEV